MNDRYSEGPKIGKRNKLVVIETVDFGVYLAGGDFDKILVPKAYVPEDCHEGDELDVFLYFDSEGRLIATTQEAKACVGEFAYMKVVSTNSIGAFLDWGLQKDLLVPFREQVEAMEEGESYIVHVYHDQTSDRIVGSARLNRFLYEEPMYTKVGQAVDLLICNQTDLGYNVIVNNSYWGLVHSNDVHQQLEAGQKTSGYIKKVRTDKKVDICFQPAGYGKIEGLAAGIYDKLQADGGFIATTDYSAPEVIYDLFQMSKKNYKKAVGLLKKQGRISLDEDGIRLKK